MLTNESPATPSEPTHFEVLISRAETIAKIVYDALAILQGVAGRAAGHEPTPLPATHDGLQATTAVGKLHSRLDLLADHAKELSTVAGVLQKLV
jgi:hypothetical protein